MWTNIIFVLLKENPGCIKNYTEIGLEIRVVPVDVTLQTKTNFEEGQWFVKDLEKQFYHQHDLQRIAQHVLGFDIKLSMVFICLSK